METHVVFHIRRFFPTEGLSITKTAVLRVRAFGENQVPSETVSASYFIGLEQPVPVISLITDGMPVIAIATQNTLLEKTVSNIREVKARGAMTIVICDEKAEIGVDAADYLIRIPKINEMLMPMVATVPMQLLAYYTSVNKGNDVDKPRNLAKSVTVE